MQRSERQQKLEWLAREERAGERNATGHRGPIFRVVALTAAQTRWVRPSHVTRLG